MRTSVMIVALAVAFGVVAGPASPADAGTRGRIYVLKKRIPFRLPTRRALHAFVRKHTTVHVWPEKKNKKRWHLEFFAFFRRRVDDREVKVRFYDVTHGTLNKQFIEGDSIYLEKRGQGELASSFDLDRGRFKVNQKILMYIVDARRRVLASATFWLRGQGEVYSGRVTFSDKEAK